MKHIPNILSFFRILLIPFFIIAVIENNMMLAGLLIIVSGFTDFLDGFLARKFKWNTRLGELLDPLADKLTQTAISISFIFIVKEYSAYFWIFLIKDFLMLLASYYAYKKKLHISSAKWFGKLATFMFYISMILIVLIPSMPDLIIHLLLATSAGLSIFSCIMYLKVFLHNNPESEIASKFEVKNKDSMN